MKWLRKILLITAILSVGEICYSQVSTAAFSFRRYNGYVQILDSAGEWRYCLYATDSATMLAPYLRKFDTTAMMSVYLRKFDTTGMMSSYLRKFDTTSMLTAYLRRSDTTAMLTPYLRKSDTASMLGTYLRKFDTTAMLSVYLRSTTAAANYATIAQNALKANISDTAAMLGAYLRKFDTTAMLGVYLRKFDTTAMMSPYMRKANNLSDVANVMTARSNLGITYARVSGSNFTTTGQALVDITGLSLALAANSVYQFEIGISASTTNVTTGIQYGVNFSAAGASIEAQIVGSFTSTASKTERINALNTATSAFLTTASQTGAVTIKGIIVVGANAGNLTAKTLKVTSGTSTVFINSYITATRIQ